MVKRRTRGLTRRRTPQAPTLPADTVERLSPTQRRIYEFVGKLKSNPDAFVPVTETDHAVEAVSDRLSLRFQLTQSILDAKKYMPRTYVFLRDPEDPEDEWAHVWSEPTAPLLVSDLAGLEKVFTELRTPTADGAQTLCIAAYRVAHQFDITLLIAQCAQERVQAYLGMRGKCLPLHFERDALEEAAAELLEPGRKLLGQWKSWKHDIEHKLRARLASQANENAGQDAPEAPASGKALFESSASVEEGEPVEDGEVAEDLEKAEPLLTDDDMAAYLGLVRDWAGQPMNEAEAALDAVLKAVAVTGEKMVSKMHQQARGHEREVRQQERRRERLQLAHDGFKARAQRQEKELAELRRQLSQKAAETSNSEHSGTQAFEQALMRWF